ncbi:hypothetical protein KKH23_08765, partial [Patescibacteria group bacterium]|nr:hypothetical protein [Patescibacteria group bacterium]
MQNYCTLRILGVWGSGGFCVSIWRGDVTTPCPPCPPCPPVPPYTSLLLATGEITPYSIGDDGDVQAGVAKAYTIQTLGDYAGNSLIEVAHYAAATISFTLAGSIVGDAAAGLVTFLAGDTVVVKGSTLNDGVYTVAVGGVAGQFTTVQALVNEAAGAMISLYKRTAHSNNAVDDDETGLQWSRNTSTGE